MRRVSTLNRRSENVRVFAVIVAKLEFGDAERHVFTAHLVERADTPRLSAVGIPGQARGWRAWWRHD